MHDERNLTVILNFLKINKRRRTQTMDACVSIEVYFIEHLMLLFL